MPRAEATPAYTSAPPVAANDVRDQFIAFFRERAAHTFHASSPVVPHDDPTLLFTNAGMNQFKPAFLGAIPPGSPLASLTRAVNSQKCIRAGGKHNDLDDVGKDSYHHTFFEMLGNWSFGDYFKREAIEWAWELLTKFWKVDPERLYASYFEGDESLGLEPDTEARDLWLELLPEERVLPGNTKDNFWEMGDTGPCGPCSEIHFDGRPDDERAAASGRDLVNMDHDQVIEIWNLVFIQFDRSPSGLKPLPAKHVDTGMGLERITRVLQHTTSNYDTDMFTPLFDAIREKTGAKPYAASFEDPVDTAYRVIADHIRTLCFSIADGAVPSNEGRGYVLRRILRRAVRFGRQTLNTTEPFFASLVPAVVDLMGDAFPELKDKQPHIEAVILDEEQSFLRTLDQGIQLFELEAKQARYRALGFEGFGFLGDDLGTVGQAANTRAIRLPNGKLAPSPAPPDGVDAEEAWVDEQVKINGVSPQIDASGAFKLYDTHGFPLDLTQLMAEERGMTVDVDGFNTLMEEARERSRGGKSGQDDPVQRVVLGTEQIASLQRRNIKPTDDARKFTSAMASATVKAIWNGTDWDETTTAGHNKHDRPVAVVLDRTNMYAEQGGQIADTGTVRVTKEASPGIGVGKGGDFRVDTVRRCGEYIAHIGHCTKNEIRVGDVVEIRYDKQRRDATAANHTATHLLNLALREVVGPETDQKGSLVAPERLRFDFNANKPLAPDDTAKLEAIVRERIGQDLKVDAGEVPLDTARSINGLRAVFGEAYPDPVRVVSIGAAVADLTADPDNDGWPALSIELCGGTHVATTGAITEFAVVAEENVAKGVRRVVALTGQAAAAAIDLADRLDTTIKAASALNDEELPARLTQLSAETDAAEVPVHRKAAHRAALEKLGERAKAVKKAAAKAGREEAVSAARDLADNAIGSVIVAELPGVGTDRAGLMSAMDTVTKKRPDAAVMLIGADHDENKLAIAAKVPEALVKAGLKAGDWVRAAATACGGKGGGRPDSAQGGGDADKLDLAIGAATEHAGVHQSDP